MTNSQSCAEAKLEACSNLTTPYPRLVELFAHTDRSTSRRAVAKATSAPALRLAEVAKLVQTAPRASRDAHCATDLSIRSAIEGYVVYAVGSRGKRLRPLLALLAGGATGKIDSGHLDLALIVDSSTSRHWLHDERDGRSGTASSTADRKRALGKFAERSTRRLVFSRMR